MSVLIRIGNATEGALSHIWSELVFVLVYEFFPYNKSDPISSRLIHALIVTAILSFAKELCYSASQWSLSSKQDS
jgi:hypothetical protein